MASVVHKKNSLGVGEYSRAMDIVVLGAEMAGERLQIHHAPYYINSYAKTTIFGYQFVSGSNKLLAGRWSSKTLPPLKGPSHGCSSSSPPVLHAPLCETVIHDRLLGQLTKVKSISQSIHPSTHLS